jgi:hypothetical protein
MKSSRFSLLFLFIGSGLVSRVVAQDTLFDQPRNIQLTTNKPDLVSEADYRALVTQAEIRLRLAGFTVQSGSTAEFATTRKEWEEKLRQAPKENAKAIAEQYSRANPPATNVILGISMARFRDKEQAFIYETEVTVLGGALLPTVSSPLQIEMKDSDGRPILNPAWAKVHYAVVWLFKSTGRYGVGSWNDISNSALPAIDEFINDYLKENPKK